ncbi:MAG: lysostaphin resistance A-like protein, partial [Halobacteriaceae archaeon]
LAPAALGVGLGVGLGLSAVDEALAALADRVDVGYSEALRTAMARETVGGWAVLLGVVVPLTAAAEEVVFRAALVGGLAAGFGVSPWLLAVASSLLFGAAHGAQGRAGVVVTTALGALLAATFVVTGSLPAVVVAHTTVNTVEFVGHELLAPDPGRL